MSDLTPKGAFTLLAVACLTIMVGCVIVPGLTEVAQGLKVTGAESWLVTVPSLGVVLFGPLAGKFIDKMGAYPALLWGLFFYGLFGAGGVFLTGLAPVLLDRLILGGFTAVVMAAGTGLISSFFSGHARLAMIAKQGMSIELGGVLFLFIGGLLATLSWRWPFILYLVAWLLLIMVLAFVPKPESKQQDFVEASESKQKQSLAALKNVYFAALFSMICFFTGVIMLPQHFHSMGINAAETGYFLSFVSLVAVAAASQMPKVVGKLKEYGTLCGAFALYACAHLIFSLADSMAVFILGAVFMGCGFGLSVPLVNHMTVELSHEAVRGRNLAYLSMAIFLGQFLAAFMAYIPGSTATIFASTASLAIIIMFALKGLHSKRRGETSKS